MLTPKLLGVVRGIKNVSQAQTNSCARGPRSEESLPHSGRLIILETRCWVTRLPQAQTGAREQHKRLIAVVGGMVGAEV